MANATVLPEDIDRSFHLLLRWEETFARSLARAVLDKPEISVWMVLIPILLLHHVHRIRQYRTGFLSFAEGVLRTKKLALEIAREELKKGKGLDDRRTPRPPPAPEFTSADLEAPEPFALEDAHMAEVDLLRSHFRLLLAQRGATHVELIRGAYPTAGEYRSFLQRLAEAEAQVHRAVLASRRGDEGSREVVSKMEAAAARLRDLEIHLIFGRGASPAGP